MFDFLFDAVIGSLSGKAQIGLLVGCLGIILLVATIYFSLRFGFWLGA